MNSQMMQKSKLELVQIKEDKETLESSLKVQLDELQNELDQSQSNNKIFKQKMYETEVELEKCRKVVKDQLMKIQDYERDKEHIRDLIKLDFEKEVDQSIKLKEELEKLQLANQSLETELSTAKEVFDVEKQELTTNIAQLESSLKDQIHQTEQQRYIFSFIFKILTILYFLWVTTRPCRAAPLLIIKTTYIFNSDLKRNSALED